MTARAGSPGRFTILPVLAGGLSGEQRLDQLECQRRQQRRTNRGQGTYDGR